MIKRFSINAAYVGSDNVVATVVVEGIPQMTAVVGFIARQNMVATVYPITGVALTHTSSLQAERYIQRQIDKGVEA